VKKKIRKIKKADVKKGKKSWLYSGVVKDHFFHPRNVLLDETNYQYDGKGIAGNPLCIAPSTLIQKNPDVVSIEKVKSDDQVLSHDGYFYAIKKIFKSRYQNNTLLIYLKNQLGKLVVTPDHLIFAMQIPRKIHSPFVHTEDKKQIPPSWVHAGDLKKGDIVLYPIPKESRPLKEINLPVFARKKYDFKSRALPSRLPLTEELLELFGYYVAEGHLKKGGLEIGFTFGSREINYAKRVQYLIKKYFGLPSLLKEKFKNNCVCVAVYNINLVKIFHEWFGDSAEKKHVPEFLLFLEPHLQQGFIQGLWRGDGYFNSTRSQPRAGFVTISEELIHQLRWLLLRQKIVPSIYRESSRTKNAVFHQSCFRIHIGDMASLEKLATILKIKFIRDSKKRHAVESWFDTQYLYLPVRRVSTVRFNDNYLLNLEVEKSHTYTTDAFLVHNCGDMMALWIKVDPETQKIKDCKWRTYGCASAIAATSMMSIMVTEKGGMPVKKALNLKPQQIIERLGGLPALKFHCSVLGLDALKEAINDYLRSKAKN